MEEGSQAAEAPRVEVECRPFRAEAECPWRASRHLLEGPMGARASFSVGHKHEKQLHHAPFVLEL